SNVTIFDLRTERRGNVREDIDDLAAKFRAGKLWPPVLRPRLPEAKRDRIELQYGQVPVGKPRHRDHRLPDVRIGREPGRVVVRSAIVEVADAGSRPHAERRVVLRRLPQQRLVLETEIRQRVEDRLSLVLLDAA